MKDLLNKIYRTAMALVIVFGLIFITLWALGIVMVVRGHGPSMEPTLADGEMYLMTKVDPENIQRGDIVGAVLEDGTRVTKRVIGLPSESVLIGYSTIWINKRDWVQEPYLGPNEFYLMGDNRRGGTWCGIVTAEQILGKVVGK